MLHLLVFNYISHFLNFHLFLDIGDISKFSYFKEFEKLGVKEPISDKVESYSGTLYQNDNNYKMIEVVSPPKEKETKHEEIEIPDSEPIFYYKPLYEEYRDPEPPKQDIKESAPTKTKVIFCKYNFVPN